VGVHAVSDKPYELAYEASIRAIEAQATLVESLRSRAGTILAATALVTSFFGGQAFARAGQSPVHVVSYATGAIGLFIGASSLTLAMLLPFSMRFSVSAATILKFADDEAFTPAEALREVALQYEAMHEANSRQLRLLVVCFRLAIVCLIGEIGLWLTVLARGEL
jgi:alcohol dehydrogenase class IV